MSLRRLASQTAIYGLSSIVARLLNYLLVPLYTHGVFTTGEYGVITQMYALVAFLQIIFTYGLETAFFRYMEKEKQNPNVYSTALISIIASSISLALIMTLFASPIASLLNVEHQNTPDMPKYIQWFGWILALDAISAIPFAKLRQQNRPIKFAIIKVIGIVLNVVLNFTFLLLFPKLGLYDPTIGVGYVFICNIVASAVTLLFLAPEIFKIKFHFDSQLWKSMLLYSLPLMIGGFSGMINETLDRLLLPILTPDKSRAMQDLGIYGACYKISILMTLFVQTFRYAAEPFFFSHAGAENAKVTFRRVMHYFVIACVFIFVAVMMYIDIVKYFVGEDFRAGLGVVPILLIANLCIGVFYNLSIWYKLTSNTRWGALLAIVGAILTILFNFLLIPRMGYMGAAWATLICYASMMVLSYFIGKKYYHVDYDVGSFFFYLSLGLIIYYVSTIIGASEAIRLAINTGLMLVFVVVVYLKERPKKLTFAGLSENKNHQ